MTSTFTHKAAQQAREVQEASLSSSQVKKSAFPVITKTRKGHKLEWSNSSACQDETNVRCKCHSGRNQSWSDDLFSMDESPKVKDKPSATSSTTGPKVSGGGGSTFT